MELIPAFILGNLPGAGTVTVTFKTYNNGGDKEISFKSSDDKWKTFKEFLGVTCLDDGFDGKGVILIISDEGEILADSDPMETKVFSFS